MKATDKEIIIKDGITESSIELIPVVRNGKTTKRMKEAWVDKSRDALAKSYIIEGHEVFIITEEIERAISSPYTNTVSLFRQDGSQIDADCVFGKSGNTIRKCIASYDVKNKKFDFSGYGLNGSRGKGQIVILRKINW
jgi:hypothetical protein